MTDYSSHPEMVATLVKPGGEIVESLTSEQAHAVHMVLGIAGEVGELVDALKKHIIYGKPIDRENLVEELGDLEFYLEGIRQALGITREECLDANIAKLSVRYKGRAYSDAAAIARLDKLREGEACGHPGCLSHISHPCEGCGRIGGRRTIGRSQ